MSARLLDLVEPVFQAVCRYNRTARNGSPMEYAVLRAEVTDLLEKCTEKARPDIALAEQYRQVELPLIFFIDSMISESSLSCAQEWNSHRLAFERNELAGDEKFFDLLEATIQETKPGADERLAVFYTCIGMGFTGWYSGQPEFLRKKMLELTPRIKAFVDLDETAFITPDTYKYTNTANLPLPMAASLVPLLIVLIGLFILVVTVNIVGFHIASSELVGALDALNAKQAAANAVKP
ncbi:MAG TPA: DotU family type IV/VI secretion system protein [Lacunisphaera sp.]|nr:DotU family type IV/VI secretion system protein [Lacunisphaera sp.]